MLPSFSPTVSSRSVAVDRCGCMQTATRRVESASNGAAPCVQAWPGLAQKLQWLLASMVDADALRRHGNMTVLRSDMLPADSAPNVHAAFTACVDVHKAAKKSDCRFLSVVFCAAFSSSFVQRQIFTPMCFCGANRQSVPVSRFRVFLPQTACLACSPLRATVRPGR